MAAQTQTAWTETSINGYTVLTSTSTTDTANDSNWSLKTPKSLDTTKPWSLIISSDAAQDGAAAPIMIWGGYSDDFALAGTAGRATATDGVQIGELTDDIGYAGAVTGMNFAMTPGSSGLANVVTISALATGMRHNVAIFPYYAFELHSDDGGTLLAHTLTWKIVQKSDGSNSPLPAVGGVGPDPS